METSDRWLIAKWGQSCYVSQRLCDLSLELVESRRPVQTFQRVYLIHKDVRTHTEGGQKCISRGIKVVEIGWPYSLKFCSGCQSLQPLILNGDLVSNSCYPKTL